MDSETELTEIETYYFINSLVNNKKINKKIIRKNWIKIFQITKIKCWNHEVKTYACEKKLIFSNLSTNNKFKHLKLSFF